MGLLDLIRPGKSSDEKQEAREGVAETKAALEAAKNPAVDDGAVNRLIQTILATGLDGTGPIDSAAEIAERARKKTASAEEAVDRVASRATIGGGVGGLVTGFGGFFTMPVAIPANVFEFYVQATRMVGAIAILRGYDIKDEHIRSAVLLTLIGSKADDVLAKAGAVTTGGRVARYALKNLPPAGLMVVNKAVGFRIASSVVGGRLVERLGRGVPVVGGAFGGGLDAYMMRKIAAQAKKEFPPRADGDAAGTRS